MKKSIWVGVLAVALAGGGWAGFKYWKQGKEATGNTEASASGQTGGESGKRKGGKKGEGRGDFGDRPVPVRTAVLQTGDMDVGVSALGTVTARNTATVKARVDGLLTQILFKEGQTVRAGEVLALIDPRPFQVALDQAQGQLARDEAQLSSARVDLERYKGLLAKDSIARQQVEQQEALVRQLEGTVKADQAAVGTARLNLEFTRITAPIAGRLGLKQVDLGNMVKSADANGLVVITQTQPITAVFAVPSEKLGAVLSSFGKGKPLEVQAFDREGKTPLATGRLVSVDNQIDASTGTVKLKAEFDNKDNALFPNQFVNVRLKTDTLKEVLLVPQPAIQRGSQGYYVYRLNEDKTVSLKVIKPGESNPQFAVVSEGLAAGDVVVTEGIDKLREGAKTEQAVDAPAAAEGRKRRERPQGQEGGARSKAAP